MIIEQILFDPLTAAELLKQLWSAASLNSGLVCLGAASTGLIIHLVYGFINDVV